MEPGVRPPTSAWCARLAAKPSRPSPVSTGVTTVMSGRCVPPANGSLRIHDHGRPGRRGRVPGRRRPAGIAPRCTGMCSACITISPVGVEQRGGAVAALLDVRRVRRAHEHGAHLLAGGAQRADHDLQRDRVQAAHPVALQHQRARGVRRAAPAVGTSRWPRAVRRPRGRGPAAHSPPDVHRRAGLGVADAHGDDLDLRILVAEAVALLVRGLERLATSPGSGRSRGRSARGTGRGSGRHRRPRHRPHVERLARQAVAAQQRR